MTCEIFYWYIPLIIASSFVKKKIYIYFINALLYPYRVGGIKQTYTDTVWFYYTLTWWTIVSILLFIIKIKAVHPFA